MYSTHTFKSQIFFFLLITNYIIINLFTLAFPMVACNICNHGTIQLKNEQSYTGGCLRCRRSFAKLLLFTIRLDQMKCRSLSKTHPKDSPNSVN